MSEERTLSFEEFIGELRELSGRVVGLEIRDTERELIVSAEGELLTPEKTGPDDWTVQVGGKTPPDRPNLRFIAASYVVLTLDGNRVAEVRDTATGIGPDIHLEARLAGSLILIIWPAMPRDEQWTDLHEENR